MVATIDVHNIIYRGRRDRAGNEQYIYDCKKSIIIIIGLTDGTASWVGLRRG